MLFKDILLFRFLGFKVTVDGSWLVLGALIIWTLSTQVFPGLYSGQAVAVYRWMSAAGFLGIMISVISHEAAHALVARYYQIPIRRIALFIFGGVAEMERQPPHPKSEGLMALAGPVMSFLLSLVFYGAAALCRADVDLKPVVTVAQVLGQVNFAIAGFNLLPALPLDGGRILRAFLWHHTKDFARATRSACAAGYFLSYGLMIYGGYALVIASHPMAGVWNIMLGFFLHDTVSVTQRSKN